MESQISLIKVFSVTKARDRDELGQRVTNWIAAHPELQILRTFVNQTSDSAFHCLSMVLICASA
jgi:hypothetical protein